MPSASLGIWRTDRLIRIAELEKQCAATTALAPPNPQLEDENHRGLIMLLSAHFQGFCRDLYTESTMVLSARIKNPSIKVLFQEQFTANRKLDQGNPNLENIRKNFERYGFTLDLPATDPANNPARITDLGKHRADLRLAGAVSAEQSGLRVVDRFERGDDPGLLDSSDAQALEAG